MVASTLLSSKRKTSRPSEGHSDRSACTEYAPCSISNVVPLWVNVALIPLRTASPKKRANPTHPSAEGDGDRCYGQRPMDLLLTHGYFLAEDEHERRVMKPYPTLGLLYISAFLKAHGHSVGVFDATF